MLADSAVLTVDGRSASFSRAPLVPPLDQVSSLKRLLQRIDTGRIGPSEGVGARRARGAAAAILEGVAGGRPRAVLHRLA